MLYLLSSALIRWANSFVLISSISAEPGPEPPPLLPVPTELALPELKPELPPVTTEVLTDSGCGIDGWPDSPVTTIELTAEEAAIEDAGGEGEPVTTPESRC
jgi:hypothetical protein